ncbi:MAG: caspase family protein [Crocinitomicaceae bacterium]
MKTRLVLLLALCFNISLGQNDLKVIIQTGHAGKINSLALNPEGTKMYSAGKDSKIVLWDIKTGKQEGEVVAHQGAINKIEFLNDSILVSCSDDKTVKLWNAASLKEIKKYGPFEYEVKSIATNSNNGNIAVGTRFLYLIKEGKIEKLKSLAYGYYDALHYMKNLGYIVFGGKRNKSTNVINETDLNIVKNINTTALSIHSFNNELVIGDLNGSVYYFDFDQLTEKIYSLNSGTVGINGVAMISDKIMFARSDGAVEIINKDKFTTYAYLKGHISEVTAVVVDSSGNSCFTSDYEGNIIQWNLKYAKLTKLLKGEANPINACKFSEDDEQLLIGYNNGILRSINLLSNNVISNRIYFSEDQKLQGWRYSIVSLDQQEGDVQWFKVLKTKPFEENPAMLSYCELWLGKWDLKKNKIRLTKQIMKEASENLISDLANGKKINWQSHFLDQSDNEVRAKFSSRNLRIQGNFIEIFDKNKNSVINRFESNHNDLITSLAYNKKYDIAVSSSWDGSIKFWNMSTYTESSSLYLCGQRDFLWLNPEKYYFSSKGALENVAFNWKGDIFPFDQFDIKYNRPDLVFEKLPFIDKAVINEMFKAYQKRLKKLGITLDDIKISKDLPVLYVEQPENLGSLTDRALLKIEASHPLEKIVDFKILINGVPVDYDKNFSPSRLVRTTIELPLISGENYIEILAINEKGVKSLKEAFSLESKLKIEKPNLYLVTIGVSRFQQSDFNLNYAAKDSKDMISSLKKSQAFKKVLVENFVDSMVTKENLHAIEKFIQGASINDVVILYAAGHGVLDDKLDYYYAAYDMDFYHPAEKGIPYEFLEDMLSKTKSRKKLFMIDACHSGEVDKDEVVITDNIVEEGEDVAFRSGVTAVQNKSGQQISSFQLSKMLFADTRESNGATVISSASGTEFAKEGAEWNNGVFTYSLITGLKTKEADLNKDGKVMLSEIQTYLNTKVLEITNGTQSPNSRVENLKTDFQLW